MVCSPFLEFHQPTAMADPHTKYISPGTRISRILQTDALSLEALAKAAPPLERLRQPLLRRMLAGRTSLSQAARIAGVPVEVLFRALEPLGFCRIPANEDSDPVNPDEPLQSEANLEAFILGCCIRELDVREDLDQGRDPLKRILAAAQALNPGEILKLINSFEPSPLIGLLGKKGYSSFTVRLNEGLVHTYFRKPVLSVESENPPQFELGQPKDLGFDYWAARWEGRFRHLDVRPLPMPQPMVEILSQLQTLPSGQALWVTHRKVPELLFGELRQVAMTWTYRCPQEGLVELLIFRESEAETSTVPS